MNVYCHSMYTIHDLEPIFYQLCQSDTPLFWLDSHPRHKEGDILWSYMGCADGPYSKTLSYCTLSKTVTLSTPNKSPQTRRISSFIDFLKNNVLPHPPQWVQDIPCPFKGGYVGWFGYEFGSECEMPSYQSASTPDVYLIYADRFIAYNHATHTLTLVAMDTDSTRANQWIASMTSWITQSIHDGIPPLVPSPTSSKLLFEWHTPQEQYVKHIHTCQEWIRQGDTYQVCLTNELRCNETLNNCYLYLTMRRHNPTPYNAFIKWSGGTVLCSSPERFLTISPTGQVETKPIKGTIQRSEDPILDQALKDSLQASAKDRSENIMIVDLLRNDLSRLCLPGSVKVPRCLSIESYKTVHQLVSTVVGQMPPQATWLDVLKVMFPGGSMTGAPKIHTMALIDRLEKRPRGIYSGVLGWMSNDGVCDLAIVIRTIIHQGNRLSIGVGGGIVHDSHPQREYEETVLKATAAIQAIVQTYFGSYCTSLFEIT